MNIIKSGLKYIDLDLVVYDISTKIRFSKPYVSYRSIFIPRYIFNVSCVPPSYSLIVKN